MLHNKFKFFGNRAERARFICNEFSQELTSSASILDVGCDENGLKQNLGKKVFGIDIAGNPDEFVDLEKESLSKFADNSYDFILCTEVLEHLDNFHEVLDDMRRVARKNILISLPNCPDIWRLFRLILTGQTGKYYGLPLSKPADRHKWFFSWPELDTFFNHYCQANNLKIKNKFLLFNYNNTPREIIIKSLLMILPVRSFAQSYWILIAKD